jgi:hypothetical protein
MKTRIIGKSVMAVMGSLKPTPPSEPERDEPFAEEEKGRVIREAVRIHEENEKWLDEKYGKDRDTKPRTPDEETLRRMD